MPKGKRNTNKRPKDPNAPKRPMSGYFLFGHEERQKNAELLKMPVAEQGKVISEKWKILSEAKKSEYKDKAEKARLEYKEQMKEYKKTPEYEKFMEEHGDDLSKKKKKGPKRITGYGEFFKDHYRKVAEENPDNAMGKNTAEVAKLWNALTSEEKEKYNTLAKEKSTHGSDDSN